MGGEVVFHFFGGGCCGCGCCGYTIGLRDALHLKNVWNHVIYLSPMAHYRGNIALCKNNAEMCTKCAEMCKKIIFWANFGQKTHFWRTEIFFFAFFFSEMDSSWKTGYKTCALWLFTCHNYNEIKMCPSPLVITLETAVKGWDDELYLLAWNHVLAGIVDEVLGT